MPVWRDEIKGRMSGISHKVYVLTLIAIIIVVFVALAFFGADYYLTNTEQRFFHEQNDLYKPGGIIGHGLGVIGFFLMIVGVLLYVARKRFGFLSYLGDLKQWLEFHVFLTSFGAVLVLFHSAFKYAGFASYAFLAMVLVIVSGIVGMFFYLQVPRTKVGRKLTLDELNNKRIKFNSDFQKKYHLDNEFIQFINSTLKAETLYFGSLFYKVIYNHLQYEKQLMFSIKNELTLRTVSKPEYTEIVKCIEDDVVLNRRIVLFEKMQAYYRYWYIIHLTLVFIMMIVVIVHVVIGILFGSRWIF